MTRLDINLPNAKYLVLIGRGLLRDIPPELAETCRAKNVAVVTDENVRDLYGQQFVDAITPHASNVTLITVPSGEKSKSLQELERLYGAFYSAGLNRVGLVIALGGGVVGDLAGFAAATYMRGVPYVQIPTTLLAQVDSSVGGKVAVNLAQGKNLAGAFYQPSLVVADVSTLNTLPEREFRAGMAEVIKYAAIGETELAELLERPNPDIERVVYLCCKRKAYYVERDERDTSDRMMLNFGHTFGHAIEKLHAFGAYNHGGAVAIGMVLAAKTGELLGVTAHSTAQKLESMLRIHGIDARFRDKINDIIPFMLGDKKNSDENITLILLKTFGEPVTHKIPASELEILLRENENG